MLPQPVMQINEQMISYLIIGNGIAGVTAAEVLRAENPQASIGVIADDSCPVYYRPALKDYLGGHVPTEKLWARPSSFYRDANIAFMAGRVIGLDGESHTVLLQSQKQVRYQKLLLANGASPARLRCPGNDLRGVTTLRTVTDYQNVLERIGAGTEAPSPIRRVVVSGSGTLALETVESLRQRGLEVTHLLRGNTLWSEVLDTTASDLVLQEERRAGVEVYLEEEIVRIIGRRGEVSSVKTNKGRRICCEMVIVAIGIEPNIKPWQISGVACGRGVQVDDALRTNLPDIYAAGDLIEVRDRLTNRTRVLGQWYPAIYQARLAAYSMLGRSEALTPFRADTFYNATFLYGLDFASVGLTITPNQPGYQELLAEPQPRSYRKVILKDGIPVGLLALGDRKQALTIKRAIDHRISLLPIANRLFNADFNLRTWLDQQGVPPPLLSIGDGQAQKQAPPAQGEQNNTIRKAVASGKPITQKMPTPPAQTVGNRRAQGQASPQEVRGEKTQRQIISSEQIRGEEVMFDSRQAQAIETSPISTNSTDCEALLAHIVDPALRLQVPETPLSQTQTLHIGRQAGVHLLLDEPSVSRQHAEISYTGAQYLLRDLGSTNGTFVNEQRLDASRPHTLQPNDILRFGNIVRLKFLLRTLPYAQDNHRVNTFTQNDHEGLDSLNLPNNNQYVEQTQNTTEQAQSAIPTSMRRDIDELYINQEQRTTGQAVLNLDGTLSTPGNTQPVPATMVEQLKKAPALVILSAEAMKNNAPPHIHFLTPGKRTTIGREDDNDIVLTDPTVSRRHAEIFFEVIGDSGSYFIRDLASSYGTLVNKTNILTPYPLSHSDRIKLGSTRIFFINLEAGKEITIRHAGVAPTNKKATTPLAAGPTPQPTTQPVGAGQAPARSGTRQTRSLQGTYPTQNNTVQQPNVIICSHCGTVNAHIARFCASCSILL